MSRFVSIFVVFAVVVLQDCNAVHQGCRAGSGVLQLHEAQASTDATDAWNSVCTQWEFPTAPSGDRGATFNSLWSSVTVHVHTYEDAIAGITADVNAILYSGAAIPDGDDNFNYRIQNWP